MNYNYFATESSANSTSSTAGIALQSCPELYEGQHFRHLYVTVKCLGLPVRKRKSCGFGQEDSLQLRAILGEEVSYKLSSGSISSSLGYECLQRLDLGHDHGTHYNSQALILVLNSVMLKYCAVGTFLYLATHEIYFLLCILFLSPS